MTATVPPLFGPDMLPDPYATYARLRGPATWNEQMGLWLLATAWAWQQGCVRRAATEAAEAV